jgi:F-type H+-transporting ATPase subunit a
MCLLTPLGAPLNLNPLLNCIEVVANLIQPLTLSVRLVANLTAGHLLLRLSGSLCLLQLPLVILELAVCTIQRYVFVILVVSYFN